MSDSLSATKLSTSFTELLNLRCKFFDSETPRSLEIPVKVRRPQLLAPFPPFPHQSNDAQVEHGINDGEDRPGDPIRGRCSKGNLLLSDRLYNSQLQRRQTYHVETEREGKGLTAKVEQSRYLCRLRFEALFHGSISPGNPTGDYGSGERSCTHISHVRVYVSLHNLQAKRRDSHTKYWPSPGRFVLKTDPFDDDARRKKYKAGPCGLKSCFWLGHAAVPLRVKI